MRMSEYGIPWKKVTTEVRRIPDCNIGWRYASKLMYKDKPVYIFVHEYKSRMWSVYFLSVDGNYEPWTIRCVDIDKKTIINSLETLRVNSLEHIVERLNRDGDMTQYALQSPSPRICPFCKHRYTEYFNISADTGPYKSIGCSRCFASVRGDTKAGALWYWNNRAD
jgi:hypothetical protein